MILVLVSPDYMDENHLCKGQIEIAEKEERWHDLFCFLIHFILFSDPLFIVFSDGLYIVFLCFQIHESTLFCFSDPWIDFIVFSTWMDFIADPPMDFIVFSDPRMQHKWSSDGDEYGTLTIAKTSYNKETYPWPTFVKYFLIKNLATFLFSPLRLCVLDCNKVFSLFPK